MAEHRIALIRGINVGRAKRVAMADLRALVEELGYREVRTVLNSGNVLFTLPPKSRGDPAARIAQALEARVGIAARVIVLTGQELDQIMRRDPLGTRADNPSRYMVFVLADPAARARLTPLTRETWQPEALALGTRVAYAWCPEGILESPLCASVGRILGDGVTARNWATMTRLHALAGGSAASR